VRRGVSLWLTVGLVFVYAFITGWRPSSARAALMVAVFMGAPLADRESSLQNSLGMAALLLLGSDTHQLFMPGFQLSFVVLWLSVIGSVPLVQRLLPLTQLDPFLPPQLANWRQRCVEPFTALVRGHAECFDRRMDRQPAVHPRPFSIRHAGGGDRELRARAAVVFVSGYHLFEPVRRSTASLRRADHFNNVNWAMAKAMVASAAWFAGLPGANFHFQTERSSHKRSRRLAGAGTAAWRGGESSAPWRNDHWLFDVGDETNFRRVLRPYLHSSGINAVTGVFLSHNDADHVGCGREGDRGI
jgi:competence protein ComEC